MRKRTLGFVALGAAASIFLSACGGGDSTGGDGGGEGAGFNAAENSVVNASDQTGGTLRYAIQDDFDSVDPGDTYYGFSWNFSRYYARTLLAYNPEPGENATDLVPDTAAGMPEPNEDFTEWTVEIKEGLKYEDGSEITAQDIKYGIIRGDFNGGSLVHGPSYFAQKLDADPDFNVYESSDPLGEFDAIETPDDHTLVFHLKESFSEFPNILIMPQTAPVPVDADTGALYQQHVMSSGPYKFDGDYEPGVKLHLVRNEEWDAESDPIRTALPDRVEVEIGVNQDEIDERLVNGELDVDLGGTGVGPAMHSRLAGDESERPNIDNLYSGALRYVNIHTPVIEDVACRQAIMYAANRDSMHRAWGGELGGDIATNLIPPQIPGSDPESDLYPSEDNKGDLDSAREKLEECGEEDGFETVIAAREGREKDVDTAEALQNALAEVGIEASIELYPASDFYGQYAGSQDFVRENNIGLSVSGWIPDWPTGYGFAQAITDGRAIVETGNYNMAELDDPEINELWDRSMQTEDPDERADIYAKIDTLVMEQAAILPVIFDRAMFYRSPELTNVYFQPGYAMYDYMALGVDRG
ncbi:ABC transporter substrate-binding protein [Nocardiopsis lucentensis]|uniref:ABC transporter substrate-binding protein n=1 Tax=Nocardiopsis lucentensis TaxID=53441 RepID=UPI00034D932C|nr:ABC transporter substrate-binding protein [Nocardiopsis lucentensis]